MAQLFSILIYLSSNFTKEISVSFHELNQIKKGLTLKDGNQANTFIQRNQIHGLGFAITIYRPNGDLQRFYQQAERLALYSFSGRDYYLSHGNVFDVLGFENHYEKFI